MKKLALLLIIITLPLLAQEVSQEIYLGLVTGAEGDSLILVDGLKVYVANLSMAKYIYGDDDTDMSLPGTLTAISYPFTATLINPGYYTKQAGNENSRSAVTQYHPAIIKIHKFYDVVNGKLVERNL